MRFASPGMGVAGALCATTNRPGLELCWDPIRVARSRLESIAPITDIRSVSYSSLKEASAFVWVSTSYNSGGFPTFVADCTTVQCISGLEQEGARIEVTFASAELDNWQRFNIGLRDFAARLIER